MTRLRWRRGAVPGLRIAALPASGHRLLLVAFAPGTRVPFHCHPKGEDLLLLSGTLCGPDPPLHAGDWRRWEPGTGHALYAPGAALALVRTGHLGRGR